MADVVLLWVWDGQRAIAALGGKQEEYTYVLATEQQTTGLGTWNSTFESALNYPTQPWQ